LKESKRILSVGTYFFIALLAAAGMKRLTLNLRASMAIWPTCGRRRKWFTWRDSFNGLKGPESEQAVKSPGERC